MGANCGRSTGRSAAEDRLIPAWNENCNGVATALAAFHGLMDK
jgi:hypothetical protein